MGTNEGLSLYQRYRPRKFDDVVGQSESVTMLKNAVATNNVRNAYLFHGNTGCGKTTNALILAAAVSCLNRKDGDYEPCGECEVCRDIFSGKESAALQIVDCAANSKVEFMREFLPKQAIQGDTKRRTIILDEVHALSSAAQATLYYGLESQPTDNLIFVLCTTNPEKLESTVVNRSVPVEFPPIGHDDLFGLVEKVLKDEGARDKVSDDNINSIVDASDGSARYALTNTEAFLAGGSGAFKIFSVKNDFLDAIASKDIGKALFAAKRLASMNSFIPPLAEAAEMMTEVVIVKNGGETDDDRARNGADSWSSEQALDAASMFSSAATTVSSLPRKYVVMLGTVSGALSPNLGGSHAPVIEKIELLGQEVAKLRSAVAQRGANAVAGPAAEAGTEARTSEDPWPDDTPPRELGNWLGGNGKAAESTEGEKEETSSNSDISDTGGSPSVNISEVFTKVVDNESAMVYARAISDEAKSIGAPVEPGDVIIFPNFGGIRITSKLSLPQRKEVHEMLKRVISSEVQVDFPR